MEKIASAIFRSHVSAFYGNECNSDVVFICVLQIVSTR